MHKYLEAGRNLAFEHDYGDDVIYRLCAIIAKGGTIISVGYNANETNGFVEHYADVAKGVERGFQISTHAEMAAILKARGKIDLRGTKIYVTRIKADGTFGMAKPCIICQHVLYNYGIKRAFYTLDSEEKHGVMKIKNPADYYQPPDRRKCSCAPGRSYSKKFSRRV